MNNARGERAVENILWLRALDATCTYDIVRDFLLVTYASDIAAVLVSIAPRTAHRQTLIKHENKSGKTGGGMEKKVFFFFKKNRVSRTEYFPSNTHQTFPSSNTHVINTHVIKHPLINSMQIRECKKKQEWGQGE